jgi:predicted enzyme related to lactoylglutathione lyase
MANPFVHVELNTTDLDKAKSFYQSLFDWQLNDVDMGGGMSYTLINVGEGHRRRHDEADDPWGAVLVAGLCAGR